MSEFILDIGHKAKTWRDLSYLAQGFIEAAFFCETSCFSKGEWDWPETQESIREGTSDGNIPNDANFSDVSAESLVAIAEFCDAFQAKAKGSLALAYERMGYDETRAGNDLYFTCAGHGVGYWDRDELTGYNLGDSLSDLCGRGEINLFFEGEHVTFYIG